MKIKLGHYTLEIALFDDSHHAQIERLAAKIARDEGPNFYSYGQVADSKGVRKIRLIKATRAHFKNGLKEAKDYVELNWPEFAK